VEETFTVQVNLKKQPACLIEMEVVAPAELTQKAHTRAIKAVSKEVDLPGFRKGKAPKELILKNYAAAVEKHWQKEIADLAFIAVQKQTKLFPLSSSTSINFNLKKHSLEGAELSFKYETEPEVPSVDPAIFKLKETAAQTVSEEQIEEAIRQARFYFASFQEIEREVQEGDYVLIDLDSIDLDPPVRVFSDTRFEVKKKAVADWMLDLLLGSKKGSVIEGLSAPDADLPEAEKKKFAPKKVRLTVKKVETVQLPEVDDTLAKKMGAENTSKLKESVRNLLQKNLDEDLLLKQREEVGDFLFSHYPFDLPSSLLKSEIKHRQSQLFSNPSFKLKYDKMGPEEKEHLEADLNHHSQKAIALFYLTRKLLFDKKIEITKDEIENEIKKTGQKKTNQENYALALSRLILTKAEDFILNHRQR
jgi:trigger factor